MSNLFIHGGWPTLLSRLVDGSDLTTDEGRDAMAVVLAGEATDAQLAGFLLGLRGKGEAAAEMSGMVDAMLDAAAPLELSQHLSLIHISEPTRPYQISYAVFCLKKKTDIRTNVGSVELQ